jgi:hypothetical protein
MVSDFTWYLGGPTVNVLTEVANEVPRFRHASSRGLKYFRRLRIIRFIVNVHNYRGNRVRILIREKLPRFLK